MHKTAIVVLLSAAVIACPTPTFGQRSISFAAADSGVVAGLLWGSGIRGVVLVHGGRHDMTSWSPQAPTIAEAGFRVLAIDLRGRGESTAGTAGPDSLSHDVLGAVRFLRSEGATEVHVVGASLGGWAAAEAAIAAAEGEIAGLVLLAAPGIDHPERLRGRTMFVVAEHDARGSGELRLDAICQQHARAGGSKELLLLDGTAHAQALFDTDQGPLLLAEIIRFLIARDDGQYSVAGPQG
jgi:thioesterase domain-containing protein